MRLPVTRRHIAHVAAIIVLSAIAVQVCADTDIGVTKTQFGTTDDGRPVHVYVLKNEAGLIAKITNYGAILTELHVPDRDGNIGDVVLGFDNLKGYLAGHPYFGAIIGRVANRIANGVFTLHGHKYELATNDGQHHLHGGEHGFDDAVWEAKEVQMPDGPAVRFQYLSPDGEEHYPGNLFVMVTYTLTDSNALRIQYTAYTDETTPVNLTNHSYFNLAGPAAGDVLDHKLMVNADKYTPSDADLIPTGEIRPVKGTPMDFTQPAEISARICELDTDPSGYDVNLVLNRDHRGLTLAARVKEPRNGRVMEMYTTEPGVQLYTGNFLDGSLTGKNDVVYEQYHGFCLEAQHFPDAVHHNNFPSIMLHPDEVYTHTTVYRFSTSE